MYIYIYICITDMSVGTFPHFAYEVVPTSTSGRPNGPRWGGLSWEKWWILIGKMMEKMMVK